MKYRESVVALRFVPIVAAKTFLLHFVAIAGTLLRMVKKQARSASELLREARSIPARDTLTEHRETIEVLRTKKYSWREIAEFLSERGVDTDHTRLFRFMKGATKMVEEKLAIPTSAEYRKALNTLRNGGKLTQKQWDMLMFHYKEAHNRTASYTELGAAVGYDVDSAKREYGKLGRLIGEAIGMQFARLDKDNPDSDPFFSSAIGSGSHYKNDAGHFQLIMHHELAKALQELG
jgi:hypothetical protein